MAQQRISGMIGRGDAQSDARAFLAVFGKHPGWNDHIDDIGLSTDRLVQIKRILYVEGIGGNIDAGAWDSLPDTGRLPDFDHLFLWRSGGEFVMGRFWSSSDGKGRKRYPMVVCAQIRAWPVSWQLTYVLPLLERLEEEFKAATTADRVIALAQNAQKELEALTAGDPAPSTRSDATATSTLAADSALGPEKRGMYRLLYQMERDLPAYLRGSARDSSRSRSIDLSPRHLRVPRAKQDEAASMLLWWRFMGEHVGDSTPLVLISPSGAGWIDILVGEPGVSQFTCIRANEHTVPLTTEIPYTFDQAFITRADERIAGAAQAPAAEQPSKKPPPVNTASVAKAIDKIKSVGTTEPRQIAMIVGAAVLGLIVIVGLILLLSGGLGTVKQSPTSNPPAPGGRNPGSGGSTGNASTNPAQNPGPAANGTPVASANPNFGPQQRADFAEWCDSVEWALDLRQRLGARDLTPLQADTHLAQTLLPLLETLRNPAFEIDPRTATPGGPRQLANLKNAPPSSAQSDEGIAKAAAALRVCRGIRAAVQPTAWPARSLLDRTAQTARQTGWTGLADALAQVSADVTLTGPTTFDSIERVVRAAGPAADLLAALSRFNQAAESLAGVGDQRLGRIRELLAGVDPGSGSPADRAASAAARMDALATLAVELDQTARDRWPRLDTDYFLASAPLEPPAAGVTEAYFRQWMQEARRDAYALLSDDADPRRTWDVARRADQIAEQITSLRQGGAQADPAVVADLERRLADARRAVEQAAGLTWNRTEQPAIARAADELDRVVGAIETDFEALTGRLTEQWERVTTRLRERASPAGVSSPALRAAWVQRRDALLARFTTPDRLTQLSDRVEDLEDFLLRLEQAVPMPPMPATLPRSISTDELERAISARREEALRDVLDAASWADDRYDPTVIDAQATARARDVAQWVQRVDQAAGAMARAESLLAGAYAADEADQGDTLLQVADHAQADRVGQTVAGVFAPILSQIDALRRIGAETDPADLATAAADARQPLGVSLTAWRRLPSAGWPADTAQLAREGEIARALLARVSAIADPDRREVLGDQIRTSQAQRWAACASRVQAGADAAAVRQVLAAREAFGVPIDALPATLRFSALAADFSRQSASFSGATDDAAAKARVQEFLSQVEALDLPVAALASVSPWLESLEALVSDTQAAPVIDPATLGPATVGWRGQEIDDRRVRFTSPDGSHWLEFVLVEPGDAQGLDQPAYLCTTELSIATLAAATQGAGRLAELAALIADNPPDSGGGPKTWQLRVRSGQESVTPADGWYVGTDVATGIQPFASPPAPPRPTPKTPVTRIGAAPAAQVASWLGCRLPTIGEWQGARSRYEGGGGEWNLRDAAWAAQQAHVRQVLAGRMGISYPDEGIFLPDSSDAPMGGDATAATLSDGTLFFDDVDRPRGRVVLHAVGNVSEFVLLSEPGESPRYGVVGRSALSAPEDDGALQDGVALLAGDELFGWADVGVRLAFPLSGDGVVAPLWRRVQRVGAEAPVLTGIPAGGG